MEEASEKDAGAASNMMWHDGLWFCINWIVLIIDLSIPADTIQIQLNYILKPEASNIYVGEYHACNFFLYLPVMHTYIFI